MLKYYQNITIFSKIRYTLNPMIIRIGTWISSSSLRGVNVSIYW